MKLDLDRINQLLAIESGTRAQPNLASIHTAVVAELNEIAQAQKEAKAPKEPAKPAPEPIFGKIAADEPADKFVQRRT